QPAQGRGGHAVVGGAPAARPASVESRGALRLASVRRDGVDTAPDLHRDRRSPAPHHSAGWLVASPLAPRRLDVALKPRENGQPRRMTLAQTPKRLRRTLARQLG